MIAPDEIEQPRLTNREKVRKPTGGWTYCYGCDRWKLHKGETCPLCGFTLNTKQASARDRRLFE
jgi:rRNA maturation endonuclease Nob1